MHKMMCHTRIHQRFQQKIGPHKTPASFPQKQDNASLCCASLCVVCVLTNRPPITHKEEQEEVVWLCCVDRINQTDQPTNGARSQFSRLFPITLSSGTHPPTSINHLLPHCSFTVLPSLLPISIPVFIFLFFFFFFFFSSFFFFFFFFFPSFTLVFSQRSWKALGKRNHACRLRQRVPVSLFA